MSEQSDAALRAAMQAAFPVHDPRLAPHYAMIEYHLGWRDEQLQPSQAATGKLIRPRLCLLACAAVGGDQMRALPAAAALQMIHDFSLIHDDIQDRSELRRGRPTVWRLWGEAQAINAGDALFVLAHLMLGRLADAGLPPALVLEATRRFDAAILRICEGQHLDLSFEERLDLSEDDYLAMIERKTATLIAASLEIGALVGGGDQPAIAALADYGLNLGLAFQMQDDVLGIWGDPQLTGKPLAADLYRRKKSMPVVFALARAQPEARRLLRSLYSNPELDDEAVAGALAILEGVDARGHTEAAAARYHAAALAALERVSVGDQHVLQQLRTLAESLLGRAS